MEMTTAGRKRNANQRVNTERSLTVRKGKVRAGAKIENTDDLQKRATKGKHQLMGVAMKEVPAKTTRSVTHKIAIVVNASVFRLLRAISGETVTLGCDDTWYHIHTWYYICNIFPILSWL